MDAFIIIDVVKRCTEVGHHERVGSEYGGRSGRGPVNREERASSRKLAVDFFFLDIEETSDMLDHLLMGECQFVVGRAVWRGRGNDVGGVASAIGGRGRAGWNEDGRRRARHCWTVVWNVTGKGGGQVVDAKRTVGWRGWSEEVGQCRRG